MHVLIAENSNPDNHLCGGLTLARTSLPLLLQPATQLHAWWHLFAGASNLPIHIKGEPKIFCGENLKLKVLVL